MTDKKSKMCDKVIKEVLFFRKGKALGEYLYQKILEEYGYMSFGSGSNPDYEKCFKKCYYEKPTHRGLSELCNLRCELNFNLGLLERIEKSKHQKSCKGDKECINYFLEVITNLKDNILYEKRRISKLEKLFSDSIAKKIIIEGILIYKKELSELLKKCKQIKAPYGLKEDLVELCEIQTEFKSRIIQRNYLNSNITKCSTEICKNNIQKEIKDVSKKILNLQKLIEFIKNELNKNK